MSTAAFVVSSWPVPLVRHLARVTGKPPQIPRSGLPDLGSMPGPRATPPTGLRAKLHAAWRRHRTRQYLLALDSDGLKDIGITFAQAETEANKPFWVA